MFMKELGEKVAKGMGTGWSVSESSETYCVLCDKTCDPQFGVRLWRDQWKKTIKVRGSWAKSKDGTEFSPENEPIIKMGEDKSPEKMAADIKRRFLFDYLTKFNESCFLRDDLNDYLAKRDKNINTFLELTGGTVNPGSGCIDVPSQNGTGGYIRRCQVDGSVQLEFGSLPVDVAIRILKTWKGES